MGNLQSDSGLDQSNWNTDRNFTHFRLGTFDDPLFFEEKYLELFNDEPRPEPVPRIHKPEHLFQLVLGYYDHIDNVSQVLDEIIRLEGRDYALFDTLDISFRWHLRTAAQRPVILTAIRSANAFIPQPMAFVNPTPGQPPAFADVLGALQLAFQLVRGGQWRGPDQQSHFHAICRFFDTSPTPPAMVLPLPQFAPDPSSVVTFTTSSVHPHGVTSNGRFLFVLGGEQQLFLFPVINSGALFAPLVRLVAIANVTSVVADLENVHLFTASQRHVLSIQSLLANKQSTPATFPLKQPLDSVCSDGRTFIALSDCRWIAAIDERGREEGSRALIRATAPSSELPTVTDGVVLAAVSPAGPSTHDVVYRLFSVRTGALVGEVHVPFREPIAGVCFDSAFATTSHQSRIGSRTR
jgi:hypothetical protein